jgi:PAS domain S-box-containing protein
MRNSKPRIRPTVALLCLLGPLLGLAVYRAASGAEQRRTANRFREEVDARAFAIRTRLAEALEAVGAVKALFESSPPVSRQAFRTFTAEFLARHRDLRALEWAPRVSRADRERHEREARAAGIAGYRITELSPSGEAVTATESEDYFPVSFIEPLEHNERALGFDVGSDPGGRAALVRAAVLDQPAMSDPVHLAQEPNASQTVLLFVPVRSRPREAQLDRWSTLAGFAVGVIRADDLLEASFPLGKADVLAKMSLRLVEDDVDGRPEVLYSSPGADRLDAPGVASWRSPINFGGQSWSLVALPTKAFLSQRHTAQPLALGLSVFIGWELMLGLIVSSRKRAREKARRKETDLVRSVLHSRIEGVVVADLEGHFIVANEAARKTLGMARTDLSPAEWSREFGLYVPGTEELFPTEKLPLLRAIRGEEVDEASVFVRNARVPDGAWVTVSGWPLRDSQGAVLGGVVVFRDVTAQKKAAEVSQQLANAVEQTADSVFITDRAGVITYVNPAFEATTGYSRSEAVGNTPRILKSGEQSPEYYRALWATIQAGSPFKGTVINRKRTGDPFYAEQTITPMRDSSSGQISHFVSVLRDMTERMKLQEQEIEMRLAASVQRRLYPERPPVVPGLDVAGVVSPALATCGDYFDLLRLGEDSLGFAVADVSGHGVGPALIMAATRAYLRSLAHTRASLEEIATEMNSLLFADLEDRRFVTMLFGFLDTRSGLLTWANMGHPAAYVLDSSGAVKATLRSTCKPLGLFPELGRCQGPPAVLEPGETLVLVTDGIIEASAPDGSEFGADGALAVVRDHLRMPAEAIANRVIKAAQTFTQGRPQDDDFTVLVVRREPAC